MIPAAVLEQVPGCAGGRPPAAVMPLPGGFGRNKVLRIDTAEGRFVWRNRLPPVERPGALPRTELAAHQLAASAGLAPAILAAATDGRWILMEYVDSPVWIEPDLESTRGMELLGTQLAKLHGLAAPAGVADADAPAMGRGYLARVAQRDPAAATALQPLVHEIERVTAGLGREGRRVLVHGDLMASNLLGPQPVLVDWEYAQVAHPAWDFACLLSYYPRLESRLAPLLAWAGLQEGEGRERLRLERERFELLNRLWDGAYGGPAQVRAG